MYATTGNSIPSERHQFWDTPEEKLIAGGGNAYHELTKMILHANWQGAQKLLETTVAPVLENLPKCLEDSASLRTIWTDPTLPFKEKLHHLLHKGSKSAEWGIAILASTIMAFGTHTVLQSPAMAKVLPNILQGPDGSLAKDFLSIIGGLGTGFTAWTVKHAVLQSIADTGSTLRGVGQSVTKKPIHTILASVLLAAGIYAGNEGREHCKNTQQSLVRQSEDAKQLHQSVSDLLSSPSPTEHLQSAISSAVRTFQMIPEAEAQKKDSKGQTGK